MALVDAHYKFLYVDMGASGSNSDGGVFGETYLKEAFEEDGPSLHVVQLDNFGGFTEAHWLLLAFSSSTSTRNK